MKKTSLKLAVASLFAAGAFTTTTASAAITLPTAGLEANSVLQFSVLAFGASSAAGISFVPLGNMTKIGDVPVVDPETGVEDLVPQFNQPVTKASVEIGWDLKVSATAGSATRSALQLKRGTRSIVVANFDLDFKANTLKADFITASAPSKKDVLYTFVKTKPEVISFKNLVLNMSSQIGNLKLPVPAQDALGDALALSPTLKATLANLDFGTIDIKVTSYKRKGGAASDKPFTAADIPTTTP